MDIVTIVAAGLVAVTLYFLMKRFATPSPPSATYSGGKVKEGEKEKEKEKEKKEDKKVPLKIFFGSQTGTAEEFANGLADEALAYGFAPEVVDLEDLAAEEDLPEVPLAIFTLATYGDGEPTDNARSFFEWVSKDGLEEDCLNGLKFTIFGLGNKTYERYNWMAKETQHHLKKLGANEVYRLGMGDDDQSLEEDFDKWKRDLWAAMCTAADLPVLAPANIVKQRRYEMSTYDSIPEKLISHFYQASSEVETSGKYLVPSDAIFSMNHKSYKTYDAKNPFLGRVVAHRELHSPKSDRSCMHIEVELIKNSYLRYTPGDHIGVFAENDRELVEDVARRLKVNLDTVIKLTPAGKAKAPVLGPFTIRRALSTYCDITTRPRQSFLREIAQYAHDDEDKARLLRLGDTSNDAAVAEYQQYIMKDYRSIVDVLDEFSSLHPPIDVFIELCPRLDPRFYSISSAMEENPSIVSITAVVVEIPKKGGKRKVHKGVCTNWLQSLQPNVGNIFLPCFIRKSEFKLPKDPSTPIIMIGPGTGLAPFRGFLQWRKHHMKESKLGPAILFFGCRNSEIDYLYREELEAAVNDGYLNTLVTAFSREQNQKVYVQHRLQERSEEIYQDYLSKKGVVYVCGDATQMAKDVMKAIKHIYEKYEGKSEKEAENIVAEMRKTHRYQEDVWHSY